MNGIKAKPARRLCALLLTGGALFSLTSCRSGNGASSAPSAEEGPRAPGVSAEIPTLPENTVLVTEPDASDFLIARDGVAYAAIVIPHNATDKVRTAAEDLQAHLNRITGASIPLCLDSEEPAAENCLLVGPTRQTAALGITQPTGYPNGEKVLLRREGNFLVLLGNDDELYTGTQFAVTMLLEYLGCGWYGPDELWWALPSHPTLAIGELEVEHTPLFRSRRTRVLGACPEIAARWYGGGDNTMTGHGLPALVPREDYWQKHPEWFALVDGQRDPFAESWWQYDYTNPELAAEVAEKVLLQLDANPTLTTYSLAANDGWEEGWCECEACAAVGNATDQLLLFANRVAAIVSEKYPHVLFSILSYHNNYFPPENVTAHPNVEVMFCRETGMTAPLEREQDILGYNAITHNTYTQSWLGNFREFIGKASLQQISIWEWYCIAAENAYWEDIPWVQGNVATRNQALWKENGVSYVFYDHGPLASYRETAESFPLRWPLWYVAAKGCWDDSLTGEQLLLDACHKLYGSAAEAMFLYYKALADSSEDCQASSICWVPPKPSEVYPPERVEQIQAIIENATSLYDDVTPQQRERMENQFALWQRARYAIDMV
ncbi:MAG TPA: DUF4838 domain-containing protein [Firmicutes bacterium]|nr:DUF4838 domain-containing protein [Bacillota bacterium]